jgi:hypothetical protein
VHDPVVAFDGVAEELEKAEAVGIAQEDVLVVLPRLNRCQVAPEKSSRRARATNRGYLGGWKSPRRGVENALNRRKISSEWKLWEGSVYRWWRRDLRADDRSFDPFTSRTE